MTFSTPQGIDLTDGELMEYISESTTMSKAMEEYGDRKSCAITTAKRLSLFLGKPRCFLLCNRCTQSQQQGCTVRHQLLSLVAHSYCFSISTAKRLCLTLAEAGAGRLAG
jgi:hypothetical protein